MFGIVCFMNANNSHVLVSIKSIQLRGSENLPFVGYCHWRWAVHTKSYGMYY